MHIPLILNFYFGISRFSADRGSSSRDPGNDGRVAHRRRQLAAGSGSSKASQQQQKTQVSSWQGYHLLTQAAKQPANHLYAGVGMTSEGQHRSRFVGAGGHNTLIGGLLLHTTRKKAQPGTAGKTSNVLLLVPVKTLNVIVQLMHLSSHLSQLQYRSSRWLQLVLQAATTSFTGLQICKVSSNRIHIHA